MDSGDRVMCLTKWFQKRFKVDYDDEVVHPDFNKYKSIHSNGDSPPKEDHMSPYTIRKKPVVEYEGVPVVDYLRECSEEDREKILYGISCEKDIDFCPKCEQFVRIKDKSDSLSGEMTKSGITHWQRCMNCGNEVLW